MPQSSVTSPFSMMPGYQMISDSQQQINQNLNMFGMGGYPRMMQNMANFSQPPQPQNQGMQQGMMIPMAMNS